MHKHIFSYFSHCKSSVDDFFTTLGNIYININQYNTNVLCFSQVVIMINNRKSHIKTVQRGFVLFGILTGLFLAALPFSMNSLNSETKLPVEMDEGYQIPKMGAYDPVISISGNDWTSNSPATGSGTIGDPYIIKDLVIDATGTTGITIISSSEYAIIQNCTILYGDYGIYFANVFNCQLIDNKFYNNSVGITIINSPATIISGSTFANQSQDITISKSSYTVIEDSSVGEGVSGSFNIFDSHYCDVSNNNISEAHDAFMFTNASHSTFTDNIVVGCISNGINLKDSIDCTLSGNNLSYCQGIEIESSDNIFLSGNNIQNSSYGIEITDSSSCTLLGNTISNSSFDGISLINAPNSNLTRNHVSDNDDSGIRLDTSANSMLVENIALRNGIPETDGHEEYGIILEYSPTSYLLGNNVTESLTTGIQIQFSPDTNLTRNFIDKHLKYGIHLKNSGGCNLSENWVSVFISIIRARVY